MGLASEEVKTRINLVDLIGGYVKLTKAGLNWKANCPFHREKTPSFMVSEERQMWHCFGCGKGGDAFGFVMEMEGLDFKEALRMLAEKAGVDLSKYQMAPAHPEKANDKKKVLEILDLAARFWEVQLWQGAGKTKILDYLRERGLKDETIKEFRLGYAPIGWRNLSEFLQKRGYDIKDIVATGLLVKKSQGEQIPNNKFPISNQVQNPSDQNPKITSYELPVTGYYDRFRDRIVFPIQDAFGKVVGFTARVAPGGDEKQAKYVNTPETAVYHKSQVLYGLDKAKQAIKEKGFTLVVEGNMDVIASHQAGLKNTVAVSGTALTAEQLSMLKRYSDNVKLLFDMDEAGEISIRRSAELAFQKELNVSVVRLPEGKDAADLANKDVAKLIQAVQQAVPAMEYLMKRIVGRSDRKDPVRKKELAKEAAGIIQNFGNEIEKRHWVKVLAQELEVEEKLMLDVLRKESRTVEYQRRTEKEKEPSEKGPQERTEAIQREIGGLLLVDREAWKKAAGNPEIDALFPEDSLIGQILSRGAEADFRLEKLIEIPEMEKEKELLQKMYFEAGFQSVPGSGVEELDLGDVWKRVQGSAQELKKEYNRKKLKNIIQDIRKAEEQGDKASLGILMEEFNRLSRELQ